MAKNYRFYLHPFQKQKLLLLFDNKLKNQLLNYGYKLNDKGLIGRVDGILIKSNKQLEGGADNRGDDMAIGF